MSGGDVFTTPDYYYSTPDYNEDYTDEACIKTKVVKFGGIVTPVFFTVVVMFSCVGNTLVLWVLLKYENLRSLTNAFLLNLAVSDLVFTVGLPFWAYYHFIGQWTFGEPACKAVSFIFFVGFYSSTIFLITMTVHRYMAVVRPLSVILNRRIYHCVLISTVVWILSFCAATPHAIFNKVVSHPTVNGNSSMSELYCDYNDINWKLFGFYQQNIFFLVAFITITFCYIQILGRLLRPTAHTRRKTIRLIFCIVVVYFLGWAPYNVAIFLDSLISWKVAPFNECNVSTAVDYVYLASRLVAFSHCCLNPIFHVFMGIKFRSHLKKMLWNICGNTNEPQNRHSHLIYSNGEEISMY
ncbi:chemokine XC receptor 1-like [Colossoma macropomum]|uniref:chemokine XC receptor 1-like n=1 Tax=Colossoma macropomum TaxID=42526 RepID=UPI001863F830|nr:chemokine XC receptor 1-like [Colossoma macropomum]